MVTRLRRRVTDPAPAAPARRALERQNAQRPLAGGQMRPWVAGRRTADDQRLPVLGEARDNAQFRARIAGLIGPGSRRVAAEAAAYEHAQSGAPTAPWVAGRRPATEAELEARAEALRGGAPRDPALLAMIAAYEEAHPELESERQLVSLRGTAEPSLEVLASISAYEEAEGIAPEPGRPVIAAARGDAPFQARVAAVGATPSDPRLLGLVEARERAERGARWTHGMTPAGDGGSSLLARPREQVADAAFQARLAALRDGGPRDPVLAELDAAYESGDPDRIFDARVVALLGGQPRNPELLAQIAARDRADQEAVAAVGQFAAGAALVKASLDSLQRTFAALSRAVVHCQDLSPVGPDLLQAAVEQIGADVEAAKAMLDTGSKLLTAVEPANPTQADLLAKGRRDIEAAQRLFYRIQPFVQMIRAMAAGHKGTRTGMPHTMIGPPCDAAGILTMLQECVLEAVTLVQVGLGMQEAATRLTTSVTVAELEFPAVPEGQGEARPEILSAAAFPQVPSPTSSPVRTDVPKVQAVVPEKEKALSHQWLTV